jgi:hypothetical protein
MVAKKKKYFYFNSVLDSKIRPLMVKSGEIRRHCWGLIKS